jgi:hypothetical protein
MNHNVPHVVPTFSHEALGDAMGPSRGGGKKRAPTSVAASGAVRGEGALAAAAIPLPHGFIQAPQPRIVKKPQSVLVPVQMQLPGMPVQSVMVQMPAESNQARARAQGSGNRGWRGAVRSVAMSEQLQRVLGAAHPVTTRPEFNTKAYAYFRDRKLLDPSNRRYALLRGADGKPDPFFALTVSPENPQGVERFNAFGPLKYVAHHLKAL